MFFLELRVPFQAHVTVGRNHFLVVRGQRPHFLLDVSEELFSATRDCLLFSARGLLNTIWKVAFLQVYKSMFYWPLTPSNQLKKTLFIMSFSDQVRPPFSHILCAIWSWLYTYLIMLTDFNSPPLKKRSYEGECPGGSSQNSAFYKCEVKSKNGLQI